MTNRKRNRRSTHRFLAQTLRCARVTVPCALALLAGQQATPHVFAGGGGGGNQLRTRSVEIVRGAFSSAPSTSIQTLAAPARDNYMPQAEHPQTAPQQRPLDARTAQQGRVLARRLIAESESAFSRGLMPVADYAEHLETATSLRLRLAQRQGDNHSQAEALAEQQQQWQRAVDQLKQFAQPASQGWAADMAYAEMQLAKSNLTVVRSRGDVVAAANSLTVVRDLGHKQFALRLADYKVGRATLPEISEAASQIIEHVSLAPQTDAQRTQSLQAINDYRGLLEDVVQRTEVHSGRFGGLGRADSLETAQAELAHATAVAAELRGDKAAMQASLGAADQLAEKTFNNQMKFYAKGTASLYDLTRSWWQREQLQAQMQRPEAANGAQTAAQPAGAANNAQQTGATNNARQSPGALSQQANLHRLLQCAEATRDLRGRNAADVTLVHSLNYLRQL